MRTKIVIILILFVIINLILSISIAAAEESKMVERLKLIKSSQQLMKEDNSSLITNELGLFVTNFGSNDKEVNMGVKLEIFPFNQKIIKFVVEGIELKTEEKLVGLLSLKAIKQSKNKFSFYLGAGSGVLGTVNYQILTGVNITENFFIEAKYINEDGTFYDSNLYGAVGFQLSF